MNAILSPGCACARAWVAAGATASSPIHAHTVTTRLINDLPKKKNYWSRRRAVARALRSEEVAELEVQLEGRCGPPELVGAVEAVRPVDADRAERRDDADSQPRAPQQPGGIELAGVRPHVAGVEERGQVEHLRQPCPHLAGHREVRLAERGGGRLPVDGVRVVAVRRDRELVVAAQGNAVLHAAHREQLVEEGRVAEHQSGPGREPHHEPDGGRAGRPTQLAERGIPATLEIQALEVARPAERTARLRDPDRVHRSARREREVDSRVPQQRYAERRADAVVAPQRGEAGARAGEALVVDAVGDEQPRVAIAEDREPELEARAPAAQRAEVRDRVAQPGVVNVEGSRNAGLPNRGIGVADGEVADILPELPLKVALLPLAEQVRLVEPEKPAHPGALPDRGAEIDVAGMLLGHAEDHVHVTLIVGGARVGEW